jgi:NADH:ubiquinone oxidoreductase subunit 3 (subunit A)
MVQLEVVGSSLSIVFYALLSVVSFVLLARVRRRKMRHDSDDFYNLSLMSKYDDVRLLFFSVLGCCALLDIPLYIACLLHDSQGVKACLWDGHDFQAVWSLHLLALCGYFLCLGIPLILWSSIIKGSNTSIFIRSMADLDMSNICLYTTFLIYAVLICIEFVSDVMNAKATDSNPSSLTSRVRSVESVFYCLVACIWVLFGIRLRFFLPILKDLNSGIRQLLMVANVFMFVIFVSYLLRAVLILNQSQRLFGEVGDVDFIHTHFVFWVAATRWLPYIVCSGLLMIIMNFASRTKSSDSRHKYAPFTNSERSESGTADGLLENLSPSNKEEFMQTIYYDGTVEYV